MHIGDRRDAPVRITVTTYDEANYTEKEVKSVEECFPIKESPVTWINIDGIHKVDIVEKIGEYFNIHPLTMEDIVNTEQRPKMEEYTDYVYVVLRMITYDKEMDSEQISLIFGENVLFSFQEKEGDVFNYVRERLKNSVGRIRKMGADYLVYALMDAVVDNYFAILESLGDTLEDTEEELLRDPGPETLQSIQMLKREMMVLRKSVWPLREVLSRLERGESQLVKENTRVYMRDVYDHTIQVIDTVETFRDMLSGMLDIYLSSISNRMNEIMKVLTIIATIFIPLSFFAGVYGMNFVYMPELQEKWGYPAILIGMAAIGAVMLLYFRRKKWL